MKGSAGRILMFVENHFPSDTRVKNECDLLQKAGYTITVVALKKKNEKKAEVIDRIQVYRIPQLEMFKKTSKENPNFLRLLWLKIKAFWGYMVEYIYFTSACYVLSLYVAVKHGFDVIHAHNPPDTLFLVAALYKPFGKKFIFDHHDLSSELYQSRYGAKQGVITQLLLFLEKCSLKIADITIATNESYRQIQIERGKVKLQNVYVVRNGPNLNRLVQMPPNERLRSMNKCILCYIGCLNPQDGVDYLLRSLQYLAFKLHRKDFYCIIIGSGDSLEELRTLAVELGIDGYVEFTGFIPDEDLLRNLSTADICVDPDPSSPLNDVSTWIKVMEYMTFGKPIVAYDLKETRFSAQNAALYVEPNNEIEFAKGIAKLMDQPDLRRIMGEFGRQRVARELQWDVVGQNLLRAYEALLTGV
jgi:glycosyltransferase involved in cell wall biosynthesis